MDWDFDGLRVVFEDSSGQVILRFTFRLVGVFTISNDRDRLAFRIMKKIDFFLADVDSRRPMCTFSV